MYIIKVSVFFLVVIIFLYNQFFYFPKKPHTGSLLRSGVSDFNVDTRVASVIFSV